MTKTDIDIPLVNPDTFRELDTLHPSLLPAPYVHGFAYVREIIKGKSPSQDNPRQTRVCDSLPYGGNMCGKEGVTVVMSPSLLRETMCGNMREALQNCNVGKLRAQAIRDHATYMSRMALASLLRARIASLEAPTVNITPGNPSPILTRLGRVRRTVSRLLSEVRSMCVGLLRVVSAIVR